MSKHEGLPDYSRRYKPAIPDDILQLSQRCPIVHRCVKMWQKGDLTWDQALMTSVVMLADLAEEQQRDLLDRMSRESPKPIVVDPLTDKPPAWEE